MKVYADFMLQFSEKYKQKNFIAIKIRNNFFFVNLQ